MNKKAARVLVGAVTVSLAAAAVATYAQEAGERSSVSYGGVTYFFPKKETIAIPADMPESHTVVSGDTLWGIAGKYLKDNFLWPIVWEENLDTISNPHRIYPGQIVKLPHGYGTGADVAAELDKFAGEGGEGGEGAGDARSVAWTSAMESAGYITTDDADDLGIGSIIGADGQQNELTSGDVVFIDLGREDEVEPGDEFTILSIARPAIHPKSGKNVGSIVSENGRLKVLCVQDETATARIVQAYTNIRRGHRVTPYSPAAIPTSTERASVEVCPPRGDRLNGVILASKYGEFGAEESVILGDRSLVYLDLGSEDGVTPGDFFRVFQTIPGGRDLPEVKRGELVVLKVQPNTSTALIVHSTGPMYIGDLIELK